MRTPHRRLSSPACIRRARQLLNRTKPIPEVAGPVAAYEAVVDSYANDYNDWLLARGRRSVAIGVQHEAEAAMDQELRGVGLAILTVGRGRRKNDIYRRYFPDGYGSVLMLSASESLATAAGLLAAMENETDTTILSRREPLTAARAALESAVAGRQAAMDAVDAARAKLEESKLAWRRAHVVFYFSFRTQFMDRRSYVESLFDLRSRPVEGEEIPPEDENAENIQAQPAVSEVTAIDQVKAAA